MAKHLGAKFALLMSAAAAVGFSFAPVAEATPVNYDFSVSITSGVLDGTTANGTFSYDDSSIVPGGVQTATNLLTSLDFTLNGTTYDATTANTGQLTFDGFGNLISFVFGTDCVVGSCTLGRGAGSFFVSSEDFAYFTRRPLGAGLGTTSYSPATPSVSVPEPAALGLFGLGALLLGLFAGARRRLG
jgi:hypothetical protein